MRELSSRSRDSRALQLEMAGKRRTAQAPASAVRLSRLRKMREVEKVAAVCYRVRSGEVEFLLVQTRGRKSRWTFPKGGAEAGLTHAQVAAIEAFEEAGVHGRIEEAAFARYFCHRGGRNSGNHTVSAHLCEVMRLSAPKEAGRNRTWFSAPKAKAKLREGRKTGEGAEFARVVEKAVERIRKVSRESFFVQSGHDGVTRDEWNRVEIEARTTNVGWTDESRSSRMQRFAAIEHVEFADDAGEPSAGEVIPFASSRQAGRDSKLFSSAKKLKALGAGTRVQ